MLIYEKYPVYDGCLILINMYGVQDDKQNDCGYQQLHFC
jgi:hypothetical protein